jgi:hypothetical protein
MGHPALISGERVSRTLTLVSWGGHQRLLSRSPFRKMRKKAVYPMMELEELVVLK